MESSFGPGPNKGKTLGRDDTERRLLQDEQGSGESGSPRGSASKIVSVRLSSSPSRGARWGQCVYDPDGSELDDKGGSGGPGGPEGLVRDDNFAFPEGRKVRSEPVSQAGQSVRIGIATRKTL